MPFFSTNSTILFFLLCWTSDYGGDVDTAVISATWTHKHRSAHRQEVILIWAQVGQQLGQRALRSPVDWIWDRAVCGPVLLTRQTNHPEKHKARNNRAAAQNTEYGTIRKGMICMEGFSLFFLKAMAKVCKVASGQKQDCIQPMWLCYKSTGLTVKVLFIVLDTTKVNKLGYIYKLFGEEDGLHGLEEGVTNVLTIFLAYSCSQL